ncbi:hypothetical protein V5O48_018532 [Marasmius crinis-equi]|uniref:Uncharacterized protein n=1 Tax=Marasmius crinis-equi TaxID=585013 RepID=A0ABR3EL10_9AGAR
MPSYVTATRPTVDETGLSISALYSSEKHGFDDVEVVWEPRMVDGSWKVYCKPCNNALFFAQGRNPYSISQHESSSTHQKNFEKHQRGNGSTSAPSRCYSPAVPFRDSWDIAATHLLQSFARRDSHREELPEITAPYYSSSSSRQPTSMPIWNFYDDDASFEPSAERSAVSDMVERVGQILEFGPDALDSDDEECEVPEAAFDRDPEDMQPSGTLNPFARP